MISGLFVMKEAPIRRSTITIRRMVGTRSSTFVRSSACTFCFMLWNRSIITGTLISAPSSTAKKIPSLPFIQKKDRKSMSAYAPSMIDVVSPTSVAAPCRFDETAIARIIGTGEIFSFLQIAIPTGATISTVATLSINAEMNPENSDMRMMTHMTVGALSRRISAIRLGIFERIKNSTRTIVPQIIRRTFQLIAPGMEARGSIPVITKMAAAPNTIQMRFDRKIVISTYIATNIIIASIFILYLFLRDSWSVICEISSSSMIPSAGS